jgi:hypothetical protein
MGSINRKITDQANQTGRHYLKNKQKAKRTGGIAQVIECLPSKYEILSSTPKYNHYHPKKK